MPQRSIAVCDLLMCWPPDAGAFVDVVNVASFLSRHARVLLVLPRITAFFRHRRNTVADRILAKYSRFFLRGAVDGNFPFQIKYIDFSGLDFHPLRIAESYIRVLSEFGPDRTFIANGWHLKAHLAKSLAPFRPILRIYAHEMLCTKADGRFFRRGKACTRNFLLGGSIDYLGCLVCSLSFYTVCPAARWVQEYVQSRAFSRGYINVVEEALAHARTVIVYNEWTASRVRRFNRRVKIVPSGVDTDLFSPAEERTGEKRVVTAVSGRVAEKHKGRDFLAAVLKAMEAVRPDMLFHITGIQSGFRGSNVREVGWFTQDRLPELYRSADIAFVPSLWPEPQGIIAIEAASCGLPVVASSVGGLRDLVLDGKSGFLVEPGNVRQAVDALSRLHDDADLRRQMGAQGRSMCVERFRWDSIFERHYRGIFLDDEE